MTWKSGLAVLLALAMPLLLGQNAQAQDEWKFGIRHLAFDVGGAWFVF